MSNSLSIPDDKRAAGGRGFQDRFLLIVTALLVALLASGSFFFAALYHVNKWFVFGAWNSIILAPRFIRDFRGHLSFPVRMACHSRPLGCRIAPVDHNCYCDPRNFC